MAPLNYVLQANLILLILVLAYSGLVGRTTRFRLNRVVLWLLVLAAISLPIARWPQVQPEPIRRAVSRTADVLREPLQAVTPTQPPVFFRFPDEKSYPASFNPTPRPNWGTLAWWAYGLFTLGLALRLIRRLIRLRVLIETGTWTPYPDFTLVQAPVDDPFSFGRFVVLDQHRYSACQLEQILRHERAHVSQNHTADVLLAELVTLAFPLNPAAYRYRQLVRQNLEYLADETVLAEGVDARVYQYSLLQVSLGTTAPALPSRFNEPSLADRIRMMLRPRSGTWSWARYWGLAGVLGVVVLVLSLRELDSTPLLTPPPANAPDCPEMNWLAFTFNADKEEWSGRLIFRDGRTRGKLPNINVIGLTNNHLTVTEEYRYNTDVFINCQPASLADLSRIESEFIDELYVYEQAPYSERSADKPWRIVVQTSPRAIFPNPTRNQFLTFLQAATISPNPLGKQDSFSMNDVLEATFFHRKNVLVERTQNEHLKLYDDLVAHTDVLINGLPASAKEVQGIHVREVDKLYTAERHFALWFRPDSPAKRFVLSIETSPRRAKRDSSYYVFSPFYSGDF